MDDTERMTLGMWVDYIIDYNAMISGDGESSEPGNRRATQADFDNF